MPRMISFAMTTAQVIAKAKRVTRRLNWQDLLPGTILIGVIKCMGLKLGEKVQRIATINVTSVRFERLDAMLVEPYGSEEAALEGFPGMSGAEFVKMFCDSLKCEPSKVVTRIEFSYVEDDQS